MGGGGILSISDYIYNTHACYMKFDFMRIFTKSEILLQNMRRIGAIFSRAVRNLYQFFTVWNLRSLKFAVQQDYLMLHHLAGATIQVAYLLNYNNHPS